MSFQQWVYVHLQLLRAFVILKPWRSTRQKSFLCVCVLHFCLLSIKSLPYRILVLLKIWFSHSCFWRLSFRHEKHLQNRATYFYNAKLFYQERESWAHHYMLLSCGIFTLSPLCLSTNVVNTVIQDCFIGKCVPHLFINHCAGASRTMKFFSI